MNRKQRYDAKRKNSKKRKLKERARMIVRKSGIEKTGQCIWCLENNKTVWHHVDYGDPIKIIELCYKCHRKCHPRKMPGGRII